MESFQSKKKLRIRLIGKTKVHGKRIGLYVVLSAEMVIPAKLRLWWTPKQENRLMAVVECMEAYQRGQKHRKAKIKVGKLHVEGCSLTGQRKDNSFPITRVRHGVHIMVSNSCTISKRLWQWDFMVHIIMLSVSSSRRRHWTSAFGT